MYGPQKGLRPDMQPILESGIHRIADLWSSFFHQDVREVPGSGAAGSMGLYLSFFAVRSLSALLCVFVFVFCSFDAYLVLLLFEARA